METGQIVAIAIAALFFAWYFAGAFLNRRRAAQLIGAIREAVGAVGQKPTIRWHGRSAFEISVAEPLAPVVDLRLLCLLEPRDFPLALAWNRLRGRRDQVLIQAVFSRPPRAKEQPDPGSLGIPGLTGVVMSAEQPHLRLTLQVGAGGEAAIAESFALVRKMAG
jgi:hypothetical protein